jgi:two-component system chemotaxis sensor kinase CheA
MMDEFIQDFLIEATEILDQLDRDLVALEKEPTSKALLASVFRAVHTIKGTSGTIGLKKLEAVGHIGENLLCRMRDGRMLLNAEITSALLAMIDTFRQIMVSLERSAKEGDLDVSGIVSRLQGILDAADATQGAAATPAAQESSAVLAQGSSAIPAQEAAAFPAAPSYAQLMSLLPPGAPPLPMPQPAPAPSAQSVCPAPAVVPPTPAATPTITSAVPPASTATPASAATPAFTAAKPASVSAAEPELLEKPSSPESAAEKLPKLGELLVESGAAKPEFVAEALAAQQQGDSRPLGEILIQKGKAAPEAVIEALQEQNEQKQSSVAANNIRVDVKLLDKVMDLVGELVLARNQILQFTATQNEPAFLKTAQRLNQITTELQEGVMKTRMQPIGNIWNKLPRVIRDLSATCGKAVRLEMEGEGTELDKTILEAIKDPLTHIVRNSVDHGIETPPERSAAGKPSAGLLRLRAFHEGGQVNIEILDDGAGIDAEKVRAKALDKGLITPQQASRMNEREAANLIFLPGLSTAAKVTNISGRGVGMDVVKTNIEKIGGTVEVNSTKGQGTALRIKIPLTLAIIPALIVTSGDERFAIPQVSLLELVRLEGENARQGIEWIHNVAVHRLRGNLLPLVDLRGELRLGGSLMASGGSEEINIVVLQAEGEQFGLVVDAILDTEEIVVKSLGKQLKGIACFAGATIMGDGKVALILDVHGLALRANLAAAERQVAVSSAKAARTGGSSATGHESWLLFRVGKAGRMAVPLSIVARLEEIDASSVESSGGRRVVQYRGEIMPIVRISEALKLPTEALAGPLQVVVYSEQGRRVGLVVDEILDIVDQQVSIDHSTENGRLLGSAVIQQHVTDLLNVPGVVAGGAAALGGGLQ